MNTRGQEFSVVKIILAAVAILIAAAFIAAMLGYGQDSISSIKFI